MMELKIVLAAFVLFTVLAVSEAGKYTTIDGQRYWSSHPMTKSWFAAQRHCTYHGMVLVDIPDEDENNRVLRIIKVNSEGSKEFWTGGTDLGSEGDFYWVSSGHSTMFSDYAVRQPDNGLHNNCYENCLEVRGDYGWKWNDACCNNQKYFICRDLTSNPLSCNTTITPRVNDSD